MRSRLVLVVAVAVIAAVAVAGWGIGSQHGDRASAAPPAASMATVRTARCHNWEEMTTAQQGRMLAGMRLFFSGVVDSPEMRGKALPDDEARKVLDGFCKQGYAANFTLYRLYGSAAAFSPEEPQG